MPHAGHSWDSRGRKGVRASVCSLQSRTCIPASSPGSAAGGDTGPAMLTSLGLFPLWSPPHKGKQTYKAVHLSGRQGPCQLPYLLRQPGPEALQRVGGLTEKQLGRVWLLPGREGHGHPCPGPRCLCCSLRLPGPQVGRVPMVGLWVRRLTSLPCRQRPPASEEWGSTEAPPSSLALLAVGTALPGRPAQT